jgi:hypothetical protein
LRNGGSWTNFFSGSRTPQSNPAYALLTPSKRLPLVWDELCCALPAWRALLPQTCCPSQLADLDVPDWVLKPALGRVGADVAIHGVTAPGERSKLIAAARRLRWQEGGLPVAVRTLDSGNERPASITRPSSYRMFWQRWLAMLGLRPNSRGGFGDFIPSSTSG